MTILDAVFLAVLSIIVLVALMGMLNSVLLTTKFELEMPKDAVQAIQLITEAYMTLERVKLGSVSIENLGETYQEAQILVIANIRTRLAIIGESIQELETSRGRHLENSFPASAKHDATSINLLEAEQNRLLKELGELAQSEFASA